MKAIKLVSYPTGRIVIIVLKLDPLQNNKIRETKNK